MAKKKTKTQPKKKQVNAENVIGLHSEVTDQPITQTLEVNYMPYAMSVNVSRAFPEIDGFKPSHRKLLYTMYEMGLLTKPRTKSANIVGQTMKLSILALLLSARVFMMHMSMCWMQRFFPRRVQKSMRVVLRKTALLTWSRLPKHTPAPRGFFLMVGAITCGIRPWHQHALHSTTPFPIDPLPCIQGTGIPYGPIRKVWRSLVLPMRVNLLLEGHMIVMKQGILRACCVKLQAWKLWPPFWVRSPQRNLSRSMRHTFNDSMPLVLPLSVTWHSLLFRGQTA